MGNWLTAEAEDTFCSLAVDAGFVDCAPVRDHDANAAIKDKQLETGDVVYIPDLVEKHDSAATEKTHIYVRKGTPLAAIRFVHGAAGTAVPDDVSLAHLEISNYRTDRAGRDGLDPFPGPNAWQFNAAADADPDTFKIEVLETKTGKAQLDVTLQALHPVYLAPGVLIDRDLNWSSAAERDRRKVDIKVFRATPKPDQRFRSAYLRLVVDERDHAAPLDKQTLLVTDDQPNEEDVEILDQEVRATYLIESCARAGTPAQCRVSAQLPVGNNEQRIRLCVGIIRRRVGDATGYHGTTEAHLRHRLFRWFRRVYAQANMAPTLIAPGIRFLDPPERNLLTVSNITGNRATGLAAGPSRMTCTIATDRGGVAAKVVNLDIPHAATPPAGLTAIEVADLLKAQIDDADFEATTFENAPVMGRLAARHSADILVKDKSGGRITISAVNSTDRTATLRLAIANLADLNDYDNAQFLCGTMDERQIIRNFDSGSDRLDCYVVGGLRTGARGESFLPGYDMDPDYRPITYQADSPVPHTCIMGADSPNGPVMDGSDNLPYTFPHEAGHALLDSNHSLTRSELMASGTSTSPSRLGTKRLCDAPVRAVYELRPTTSVGNPSATWGHYYTSSATRLSTMAAGLNAKLFEAW